MHSNSLLSPDSTSPGCPPPVQLIGQIASRLILPVYLFPEHSVDVFITLIKAKSNILRMMVTCAMTAATSPMDRLKFPSIAYMLFYYFHLLLAIIPQLFVEPPNKPIGFQTQVSFSIWVCYPKIVLSFSQPLAILFSQFLYIVIQTVWHSNNICIVIHIIKQNRNKFHVTFSFIVLIKNSNMQISNYNMQSIAPYPTSIRMRFR